MKIRNWRFWRSLYVFLRCIASSIRNFGQRVCYRWCLIIGGDFGPHNPQRPFREIRDFVRPYRSNNNNIPLAVT